MTQVGPVEVLVVSFPGSKFNGSIAPALQDVVARGDISVVDLAFIAKTKEEDVVIVELEELEDELSGAFDATAGDLLGLLNEDDLMALGDQLDPGSSAVAIVFEHTWARELAAAVQSTEGQVIFSERIPRNIVQAAVAATTA